MSAVALVISLLLSPDALPTWTVCSFRNATGLPCPGCGLTRSWCALSHGHFADAHRHHPLGIALYVAAIFAVPAPWLLRRWPALSTPRLLLAFKGLSLGFAAVFLVFGTYRMVTVARAPATAAPAHAAPRP